MNDRQAFELADVALGLAVERQVQEARMLLAKLLRASDVERVYGMCCVFAEGAHLALKRMAGDQAPDLEAGDCWGLDQVRTGADGPYVLFALRFIVAYSNGDRDTARAHYQVLVDAGGDARIRGVARLFSAAAQLIREAAEPVEGEGG